MKIKKAIFLDRDGTLIKGIIKQNQKNFKLRPPYKKKELHIYEDLTHLREFLSKYHLFIITNQPDIKKGYLSKKFNNLINSSIKKIINIKKIYTCFCLETDADCNCYKPSPGLILSAIKEFNIDIKYSYFIGDTWRDIGLCKNINLKSILIDRGYFKYMKNDFKIRKLKPDHIIKSLLDIKKIIK